MQKSKTVTPKTLFKLNDSLNNVLQTFPVKVDEYATLVREINKDASNKTEIEELYCKILHFSIFELLLILDLSSAIKLCLDNDGYSGRYILKHLYVIPIEGFKQLYHFESTKKDKRNQSLWIKDIKPLVENDFPNLLNHYQDLSLKLDILSKQLPDKDYRDYAVHYDKDIMKVYCMLESLDRESVIKSSLPFWKILLGLAKFLRDLTNEMRGKIRNKYE